MRRHLNLIADLENEIRLLENAVLYFERSGCGRGGVVMRGDIRLLNLAERIRKQRAKGPRQRSMRA